MDIKDGYWIDRVENVAIHFYSYKVHTTRIPVRGKEKTEIGSFDVTSRARLVLKKKIFVVKQHIILTHAQDRRERE